MSSRNDGLLDRYGRETPDPTPLAPPIGHNPQPSLTQQIRDMVRSERLARDLEASGVETFEDADDFDVGDDYDPSSPYEEDFDPPVPVSELKARAAKAADDLKKAVAATKASWKPAEPLSVAPVGDTSDEADASPAPAEPAPSTSS